jgi:peptidoglycan/xylan/chitin deacetylase (PgdA/CDA1 family)
LRKIFATEQRRELKDSKDYLENLLGKKIEIICYPFGLYNDQVKQIAKEVGYKAALTFDQDAWQNPDDLFALTRISVYPELDALKFLDKLSAEGGKSEK